jgi:putative DNA-invertase from lambdoid prophage Rac
VEKDWKDLLALLPGGDPKIYAYVRVSSRHQTAEAQLHAIAQYAIREKVGLCPENVVSDIAVSANSQRFPWDKRPGLSALLEKLRPGDTLLLSEQSRLARDQLEMGDVMTWFRRRVARAVDCRMKRALCDTPEDVHFTMTLAYMSEKERLHLVARTKEGLAAAKARGTRIGGKPGPRSSRLDEHSDEIHRRRACEDSLRTIAEDLKCDHKTLREWIERREKRGQALLAERWPDPSKPPADVVAVLDAALAIGLSEGTILQALEFIVPPVRKEILVVLARRLGAHFLERHRLIKK